MEHLTVLWDYFKRNESECHCMPSICVQKDCYFPIFVATFSHQGRKMQIKDGFFRTNSIFSRTPLIFRQPPLPKVANIYVLPLGLDVWACTFILMLIITVGMILQLAHPHLNSVSSLDVVTFVLGAFCQQGTHLQIPTLSGRFIALTTFFATLALFTSYSASIVTLLQSPSHYINTLDDLIASPIKVGIHEG